MCFLIHTHTHLHSMDFTDAGCFLFLMLHTRICTCPRLQACEASLNVVFHEMMEQMTGLRPVEPEEK
jgi:hypothetical protein